MRTALRTERLDLRAFEVEDADEIHAILGDPASNTVGDGGYALEATAAALDELLLDRPRVWATIRPANAPSIRIVERLGFRADRTEQDAKGALRYFVRDR